MRKRNESIDPSLLSPGSAASGDGTRRRTNATSIDDDDRLLRIDEAAWMLGLSVGSLYHFVSEKRITVTRLSGRCIRFSRRALREWIESRTQKAERNP